VRSKSLRGRSPKALGNGGYVMLLMARGGNQHPGGDFLTLFPELVANDVNIGSPSRVRETRCAATI